MTQPKVSVQKLTDFIPDGHNANEHTERGHAQVTESVQRFGAGRSLLVDRNGRVIAGNLTQEVMTELGFEDVLVVDTDGKTPVIVRRVDIDIDSPEGRGLAIADNRTAEVSLAWNATELAWAEEQGADLGLWWNSSELDALDFGEKDDLPEDPGVQVDKADELNEKWQVKHGDLWEVPSAATPGKAHRILCGDSTKAEDVERLMGGEKADAVVTDPPYGVNHDTNYTRFSGGLSNSRDFEKPIYGDESPFNPTWLLKHKQVILWGANAYSNMLPCGSWLVWDKRHKEQEKILSDGEVAWLNRGHGVYIFNHAWNGFLRESEQGKTLHPTQKPVALFEWCFTYLKDGNLIFDPYCGSGPTAVAAERTGRICYGMEIEPKYVAVALERLAGLGLEPHRVEVTGVTL
jgi:site-specific DNA-methyltransferase (adenine-specific)